MGISRRFLAVACAIGASVIASAGPVAATDADTLHANTQQVAVDGNNQLIVDGSFDFLGVNGKWDGEFECHAVAVPPKSAVSTVIDACYLEIYDGYKSAAIVNSKADAVGVGPVKKAAQDPQLTLCIRAHAVFKGGVVISQQISSASNIPTPQTPRPCVHG
ncbi:MAG: hypothetical protein QOE92_2223 [Chloroflexota bacterium]|nr:hypothetical protein [Chloroflexota bacterium]